MKSLTVATMRNYTTSENLEFSKHILSAFNQADARALKLNEPVDHLQEAVSALDEVFQLSIAIHSSIDVPLLDKRRIEIVNSMRLLFKSRLTSKDPDKARMADIALKTLNHNCSEIQSGSMSHKTGRIKAFIRDMNNKPGLSDSLNTFNLLSEFTELTEINQSIFEYYNKKKNAPKISEKRKAIKLAYDELINQTQAFVLVAEDKAPYKAILDEVDYQADRFNTSAKFRKSLKKKKDESTEDQKDFPMTDTAF